MVSAPIIVLTGGPCGGKTTLIEELRADDPDCDHWVMVPEAAPLLFRAGLDGRQKRFQKSVIQLQTALEDSCAEAIRLGQVLLCHRGTLDALAYWLRNGWDESEFFSFTGVSREGCLERYHAVIHLQSAAIGAESHYRRWPDAHRPESLKQAAEIDRFCEYVWGGHSRYITIDNTSPCWLEKSRSAKTALSQTLAFRGRKT